jgi:hypothetical protein
MNANGVTVHRGTDVIAVGPADGHEWQFVARTLLDYLNKAKP